MSEIKQILIYYGSKEEFNKLIPVEYENLTELVYQVDSDRKTMIHFHYMANDKVREDDKTEEKKKIENFVIFSDEYAGVLEHVIMNFANFLAKFDVEKLFIQNPPIQIYNQLLRLKPKVEIKCQEYKTITTETISELDKNFDDKIIGQEGAKLDLIKAILPLTMPYRDKPIVIMFYGKSGVGKTETAKYLSELMGETLFRKQFSMYQNSQFSTYLFGGTHSEKSFAKDLLDRKSNILLLDEFDKSHESFHSAFYQMFDEGVYEDQNYQVFLKKSVIICTSNYLDLVEIEKNLGSALFNRFDSIIHFNDLDKITRTKIGNNDYSKYKEYYGFDLDPQVKQRMDDNILKCENARKINKYVESIFSYSLLVKSKDK